MIRLRPRSPQRDMMRVLFAAIGDDRDAVCLAYVEAEQEGKVGRPRGAEDMAPGTHARTLWQEGKLQGWFR